MSDPTSVMRAPSAIQSAIIPGIQSASSVPGNKPGLAVAQATSKQGVATVAQATAVRQAPTAIKTAPMQPQQPEKG